MSDRWEQRAPWTGIVAVVLFAIAFIVGGETPAFDASTRDVLDFYDDQTSQVITGILVLYGAILLVFFAATLRSALRGAEALRGLVLIGGALMALGLGIFAGLNFTLTDLANSDHLDRISPGTLQSLNALNSDFFFPVVIGTAVFLISAALAIFRTGALPRWMGWVALVLGIVVLTPAGFFAFLISGLWIVAAAVMLLQGHRTEAREGAASTAPS
jgi:hypothetical protein